MSEVEYNGVKYPNLKEFCYENGLSYGMIRYRLHQGWSLEDVISKPKEITSVGKQFIYNGKEYSSLTSFCKEYSLNYDLVKSRLKYGWSFEDAISKPKQERNTVLYDGKFYKSITELAKDVGISVHTIRSRLNSGYSVEESIIISDIELKKQSDLSYECKCRHCGLKFLGTLKTAKKHASQHKEDYKNTTIEGAFNNIRYIKVEYKGVKYPSLKDFCCELELDYGLVKSRLSNGWSLEDAVSKQVRRTAHKEFSYNGKEYSSLSSFCRENDLSYHLVRNRLGYGWSFEDAIGKSKETGKQFIYGGKKYSSIKSFCKENGLSYSLVNGRLRLGWSFEDAVSEPKQEYNVFYDGKFYRSVIKLAEDIGISPTTIKSRLKSGYSLEESIVISDIKLKKKSDFFYECRCKHCGLQFLGTLDIAKKHAREHKEDYENMILNYQD